MYYGEGMKKYLTLFIICLCLCFNGVKAEEVKFSKCIDGDTADLIIDGEIKKVRLLAIDTPETKHPTKGSEPYGKEASEYTCNALRESKDISLEYEKDKTDKYDRVLAWVFTDGELLQGKLVREGLAKVAYLYDDYKYTDKLQRYEDGAKKKKINIWSDYKEDYTQYIYVVVAAAMVLILCIYDKNYRKKTVKKIKKKATKEVDKLFK